MLNTKFRHLKYRLIVPRDCKLAAVLGAILLQQSSTKFVSCVASATYGLGVSVPFCREIHPASHLQYDEVWKRNDTTMIVQFQSGKVPVPDLLRSAAIPVVHTRGRETK